jgi:hypothetical protein
MKTVKMLRWMMVMVTAPTMAATVDRPCTPAEKWNFQSERKGVWMNRYHAFLVDQESPWMAFSDAIKLKRMSRIMNSANFESEFSEYWVGRVFLQIGLEPLAREYFTSSASHSTHESIRKASKACLEKTKSPATSRLNEKELAFLIRGRDLYSQGKFNESAAELLKIDKRSNLKIDSMNDLSWAYLQSGRIQETIGIALQLRSGIFRNTFSPESMMTAVMALNESCSYPDASRMIQLFLRDYGPSNEWLEKKANGSDPYREISLALKNQSDVPSKIRTEWIRHPGFLIRQDEINRMISHQRKIRAIPSKIDINRNTLKRNLISRIQKLMKKPDASEFREIRKNLRRLVRFNRSSQTMISVTAKYETEIPQRQQDLIREMNLELKRKNRELLLTLKKVRENIDLVEVEIYQGASKDLLGLKKPRFKKESLPGEQQTVLAWNWGSFNSAELERAEIWEDEIGALKADTKDKCH